MGQKVNPTSWRLKINENWKSRWFGRGNYAELLHQDFRIRRYIMEEFKIAAISSVLIDRDANKITVIVRTARPGVIIGRGGAGANKIKDGIEKFVRGSKVKVNIEEVKNPDADAGVVAGNISAQIEKRMPFRRAMKQALDKADQAGVKGIKIQISGRLNGAEIARSEKLTQGLVPLSTLKSHIDYSFVVAKTTYGTVGIKVWIYKGEKKFEIAADTESGANGK